MNYLELELLENQLRHYKVKIDFVKVDGTNRVMICTKNPDIITAINMPSGTNNKTENAQVIRVFDLEKQSWRSMRKANVIHFEVLNA